MATTTNISETLRSIAADPMWANHSEINKATAIKAASAIEVLARLLNGYVQEDADTRHEGFDVEADDFPTKDEARKVEAVAILRTLNVLPRSIR
jgi:hypothetical protein